MNHVYRLIWSHRFNRWVAVSENTRARRKGGGRRLAVAALTLSCAVVHAAPGGGQVVSGNGQISSSGNTTTITQHSQSLSVNWQSFNIAPQETVDFVQPSASAVAVNRIFDTNGTQILGHLNANGQVYLINPNGVLFGQGAVVNVGALVASSLNVTDVGAATRSFSGTGTGSVVNEGAITAAPGGYVVLMGGHVSNSGTITARLGTVALAAGSAVTLSFDKDDLVSVEVDRSTLNNLASNGGLIQVDGGRVIMTAGARDALLASAVNNTGVIEARTVEDHDGEITLLAGMSAGRVSVGGTLDASAPNGGDGGHIETSAAHVSVANDAHVTTAAARGLTGSWLVDPQDFTVASSGGDITGTALSAELATTNVTLQSSAGATAGSGNVNVNDAVTWSGNNTLTLSASNNVNVNANITATGAAAGLVLNPNTANGGEAASGSGVFALGPGASITLSGATPSLQISGQTYTVINSLGAEGSTTGTDLQGMQGNLSGRYALGTDIDASATSGWNGGAGFAPIGSGAQFMGTFNGLGHTVNNLTINDPSASSPVGLFAVLGSGATVSNLGLVGAAVTGYYYVGAVAGESFGTVTNTYSTGATYGKYAVGGLVGLSYGTVSNAYSAATVGSRYGWGGGLVGGNYGGTVASSHATGNVSSSSYGVGGLVGAVTNSGSVANSYATGTITATGNYGRRVGGLVGTDYSGDVTNSYATGAVSGNHALGGLIGVAFSGTISNVYATGSVTVTNAQAGGLIGVNEATLSNSYATGAVSGTGGQLGGLIAGNYGASVTNSYWNTTTTGRSSSAAGTGLTTAQMTSAANFAGFNFTTSPGAGGNNWVIVDTDSTLNNANGAAGATYPMLASEYSTNITNAHQLQLMALNLAGSYLLSADIDATRTSGTHDVWVGGAGFVPIGSSDSNLGIPFTGTLDGQGHAIDGLTMSQSSRTGMGLMGQLGAAGSVTNVGLTSVAVSGYGSSGALVGLNEGTISNSYSTGTVSANYGTGGLVGLNYGTLSRAHSAATVSAVWNSAGGLIGTNHGAVSSSYATGSVSSTGYGSGGLVGNQFTGASITDSYATGSVTGIGANGRRVGGLVGTNYGGDVTNSYATGAISGNHALGGLIGVAFGGNISNVYATGSVTVTSGQAGGLIGVNEANLSNSYATGAVSGTGGQLGGLIAGNYGVTVVNSYWDKTTTGLSSSAAGTGLTTAQMRQQVSFTGWDFAGTWTIYEGLTDPLLQNFMTPLTVTANAAGKTYDANAYSGGNGVTYSVTPSASLLGTLTYSGSAQGAVNAGTYSITPSGLYSDQQGYLISYVSGALTVNKATLTVTGSSVGNKVYEGTDAATLSGGTLQGVIGSDNVTLAMQAGTFASVNVGNGITVTAADTLGGTAAGNYNLTQPTGLIGNITPATLTVTGTSVANKVYDGTPAATLTGGTLRGIVGSDNVTLASQAGTFASANAGNGIAVTASDVLGGSAAANYTLAQPSGLIGNITPAPLTVTGTTVANKVYDGTNVANLTGGTLSGIIGSDAVTLTQSGAFASANVGNGVAVTASDSLAGAAASNYTLTQLTGLSASITPATLTYIATPGVVTTGRTPSGLTGTVSGFMATDNVANATSGALTWTTAATASSPAGSYAIEGGGLAANNYVFVQDPNNLFALSMVSPPVTSLPEVAGLERDVLPTGLSPTALLDTTSLVPRGNTLYLDGKGEVVIEDQGVSLPPQAAGTH